MPSDPPKAPVPITVFTGFLGAGKTSIILSLLPQLPKGYRCTLLKNEFGDIEGMVDTPLMYLLTGGPTNFCMLGHGYQVDSQLAKQSSLASVSEILNGCMCCVLVGQMKTALLEIMETQNPDRIIIECSGSAFPATLAFQIRELERETNHALALDAIVTVIDAENFRGYEDTSTTARMQAQYTDVILINKWEHISERALDDVVDHLNTLNDLTPKIRCTGRAGVDPSLIFGLDSKLFLENVDVRSGGGKGSLPLDASTTHHDEVETATVWRGTKPSTITHDHQHSGDSCTCGPSADAHSHHSPEVLSQGTSSQPVDEAILSDALAGLSKETIYRVKGFVRLDSGFKILNWAFGRYDMHVWEGESVDGQEGVIIKLTVMGERGEVKRAARKFAEKLGAELSV